MWLPSTAPNGNNWHTRDSPNQVLSYCGQLPSGIERLLRIEADNFVTSPLLQTRRSGHFCRTLCIATEFGLYLLPPTAGVWRIVSEVVRSSDGKYFFLVFLLKEKTKRTTFANPSLVRCFFSSTNFKTLLKTRNSCRFCE